MGIVLPGKKTNEKESVTEDEPLSFRQLVKYPIIEDVANSVNAAGLNDTLGWICVPTVHSTSILSL
jgi:hypothetical protein